MEHAGGGTTAGDQVKIRQAIIDAYNRVTRERDWAYLLNEHRIQLDVKYTTGTIVYDHTGGTNEKEVTLTTGTWPSWAAEGRIVIDSVVHQVHSRVSDSVITLDATMNPGSDIAAGTTYSLYHTTYPLPENFRKMHDIIEESGWWANYYVHPNEWKQLERATTNQESLFAWTLMFDPDIHSRWVLQVFGSPSEAKTLDFIMLRFARSLWFTGFDTALDRIGTITANTASVTGSGTAFTANMIGSVLRTRDTSDHPQARTGLKPWIAQEVITARASVSAITLNAALDTDAAATTKYIITDPLDIDRTLVNAFYRCAQWQYDISSNASDGQIRKSLHMYKDELNLAMENADRVMVPDSSRSNRWSYSARDLMYQLSSKDFSGESRI